MSSLPAIRSTMQRPSEGVRLGEVLVRTGLLSREALSHALREQQSSGKRLGEILMARKAITRAELHTALSEQIENLGLPHLPDAVKDFAVQDGAVVYVLQGRHGAVALQSWLEDVRRKAGDLVDVVPCNMEEFANVRRGQGTSTKQDVASLVAVRRVRTMFAEAAERGASDVHLTLGEEEDGSGLHVQYRINGSLRSVRDIPYSEGAPMFRAMFQGMAKVADSTVREGEDQHAVIADPVFLRAANGQALPLSGIRLARSTVVRGQNLAARLLFLRQQDARGDARLAALGYSPRHQRTFARLARKTTGINPLTGPTGHGKSTTLAQMIHAILEARDGIRVITIEDPIEYEFNHPQVWQYVIANANTDEEKSLAFSGKLKTALRQDPDVLMVGEIRGLETAQEAINASITGHPVWTTLHANDAFLVVPRLVAMGVDRFMLGDPTVLSSFTGQRLVKTPCKHCAVSMRDIRAVLPADEAQALEAWAPLSHFGDLSRVQLRGPGCDHCAGTGESVRTVIAQVILTDEELLSDLLEHGAAVARRQYMAREHAEISMMAHGVLKVLAGQVDPRQLVDVLGPIEPPGKRQRQLTEDDL